MITSKKYLIIAVFGIVCIAISIGIIKQYVKKSQNEHPLQISKRSAIASSEKSTYTAKEEPETNSNIDNPIAITSSEKSAHIAKKEIETTNKINNPFNNISSTHKSVNDKDWQQIPVAVQDIKDIDLDDGCEVSLNAKQIAFQPSKKNVEFEQNISVLKMPWYEKKERNEELQEAIKSLASMGDEIIESIMKDFNRYDQTYAFRHKAVQVLEQMKTDKAHETLLQIALGDTIEDTNSLKEWASSAYIASLEDKSEARKLLVSQDIGVLNNALLVLKGEPIDDALLFRLTEILGFNNWALCWATSSMMTEDPTQTYAKEKCSVLAKAIASVKDIPQADKIYPHHFYTYAEKTYSSYIDAMYKMRGADRYLMYLTPPVSNETRTMRECIVIARARSGDVFVKNEIIQILQNPDAGMFRSWAALGLGRIGSRQDLLLLQQIANSDPLERDRGISVPLPDKQFFPVRESAKQAIKMIEAKYKT